MGWRLPQFYRRRSSFWEEEAQSAPSSPVEVSRGSQRLRSQEEDLRRRFLLFERRLAVVLVVLV
ncbi:hypothetical protein F2Q69_00061801 [Brassica cretica]|uniref:Uncharacterized protein n=1 Tax=Brassica cretica TaxID=69181 RepID=A0A8S9RKG4_BRACR|nr:hypothetical protein F2Q69_00061801 [Brassica cretica]